MVHQEKNLFNNSRFYILVTSILLSALTFSYLRLQISSDQLYFIRLQQVFGLLSITFWYIAIAISPIGYIIGKQRTKPLEFARRAIGVSAFYFALLHAGVALWGQLGGLSHLQFLPSIFVWSLIAGAGGLVILLSMALTSFDKVVAFMTFRKWKWLHRMVYAGGILVVLHIWTIGTHLSYSGVQLGAFIALVVLCGLELYRTIKLLNTRYLGFNTAESSILFLFSWAIVTLGIFMLPFFIDNYHSQHTETSGISHTGAHK